MKGFLPSQWYMSVSILLPVSDIFFFPSSKVLVSQSYSWIFFSIFEGFLKAKYFPTVKVHAQGFQTNKKYKKIPETNPYPGEEHLRRTLQICIKHAIYFSQWYVSVLFF